MTQTSKSPFYIVQDFVSPLMCEEIVDQLDFLTPDTDKQGNTVYSLKTNDEYEQVIHQELQQHKRDIEVRYSVSYDAMSQAFFEWYPEGSQGRLHAENSEYLHQKWVRVRDRDLSCVLFLSDYNDKPNFDDEYEVYGGKLEFPQHGFGFNAQRGTMVVFPSVPHFINTISPIRIGNLFVARFHIKTTVPFLYDPQAFPGNYQTWLREFV